MATFRLEPPPPFEFSAPTEWPRWIRRFERFRIASELYQKDEPTQVNALVYCMGDEADNILCSFNLTKKEKESYELVKDRFEKHFIVRRNIIFERAKFNQRRQGQSESVDSFVTDLYCLSEHCAFGSLQEELIRDRIVVGLSDSKLAEALQLDPELTLTKAIDKARQSEAVHKQQQVVRGLEGSKNTCIEVDAVKHHKKKLAQKSVTKPQQTLAKSVNQQDKTAENGQRGQCRKCGKSPGHAYQNCPARTSTCNKCSRRGHFAKVCYSSQKVCTISGTRDFFLGSVDGFSSTDKWCVNLKLNNTEVNFKIDTGADVSVITEGDFQDLTDVELLRTDKRLFGPGGSRLKVLGELACILSAKDKSTLQTIFVVKGLKKSLLGRPAVEALGLVARIDSIRQPELEFSELFEGLGCLGKEFEYTIKLEEGAKPYSLLCPRRIPIPLQAAVESELKRMLDLGVISPVEESTDWCAGMVVVPKTNGEVRICVDYTHLNQYVRRERFILPSSEQIFGNMSGARVFSKLDANQGFWQIPLAESSSNLTTFITPFGRFRFNRLPFGICSAPEVFQRTILKILKDTPGVTGQMDDVLVYGENELEHDTHLRESLKKVKASGLTLNKKKCEFRKNTIIFIGHRLTPEGIQPAVDKISAVSKMTVPESSTDVKRFLGMANYLGKFIPNLAEMALPLTHLLRSANAWVWNGEQQQAFENIKSALVKAPTLAFYDCELETRVTTDASSHGLGAVLEQKQREGEWKPVAFASKTLNDTQRGYSQIEKEGLGLVWGCEKFHNFLLGKQFSLVTDHKPLIPIMSTKCLDDLSPRLQRFRLRLMRYSYSIIYVPGKQIVTADALSRQPLPNTQETSDFEEEASVYVNCVLNNFPVYPEKLQQIKLEQKNDNECQELVKICTRGWSQKDKLSPVGKAYWPHQAELTVQDGLLLYGQRIFIPDVLRRSILEKIHEGHLGICKCKWRAKQAVWWKGIGADITRRVSSCTICNKYRPDTAHPLMPTPLPKGPWQELATDLFEWCGQNYLLVVDYFSRFPLLARLSSTTSSNVINQLKSMFAVHGIPDRVRSDNGPQYSSGEFQAFSRDYGFKHVTSSPGYPQSNGMAEATVKTIKALLNKADDPYLAIMAYRSTPLQHGQSPAELLFGRKIQTRLPVLKDTLKPQWPHLREFQNKDARIKTRQKKSYDRAHRAMKTLNYKQGDRVWIPATKMHGTVVGETPYPRSYMIETDNRTVRRNSRHLRQQTTEVTSSTTEREQPSPTPKTRPPLQALERQSPTISRKNIGSYRTRSGRTSIPPKRLGVDF